MQRAVPRVSEATPDRVSIGLRREFEVPPAEDTALEGLEDLSEVGQGDIGHTGELGESARCQRRRAPLTPGRHRGEVGVTAPVVRGHAELEEELLVDVLPREHGSPAEALLHQEALVREELAQAGEVRLLVRAARGDRRRPLGDALLAQGPVEGLEANGGGDLCYNMT